ncbi:hypothetical protein SAMN05660841_00895 [Sphingobacterium nematocida]|uniref:Uncharacterized protein n=1 Tax=Sphingobacterium nematocida TaxID=1513896 RepID=A0A1T5BQV6_9SPHI|nr:hypothetical protein [Sphingobacterium nematocida]SKB49762.1 hypothetical protein SAMN05660841_00895 [Sphingobacterium nematocida]
MAKSKDNVVMQGASGKVGRNLVFRQKGDQTIIAKRPRTVTGRVLTDKQLAVQNKFYDASQYAKRAMLDPILKKAYAEKATINQQPYNVAFRDYFNEPTIRKFDDSAYKGLVGDIITIQVKDIMKVTEVSIEILDQADVHIESGLATATDDSNSQWTYEATVANVDYDTAKFKITMLDTPKKITKVQKSYGEDMNP